MAENMGVLDFSLSPAQLEDWGLFLMSEEPL